MPHHHFSGVLAAGSPAALRIPTHFAISPHLVPAIACLFQFAVQMDLAMRADAQIRWPRNAAQPDNSCLFCLTRRH
jgi:hypothetical protein